MLELPKSRLVPTALAAVLAAAGAFSVTTSGDYMPHAALGGDNAGPALLALVHGHLHLFLDRQPVMGLVSLLLRLPVTAAAYALGAGDLTAYRWGAFVCLLPCALLVAWLLGAAGRDRRRLLGAVVVGVIVLIGPLTRNAIENGHPEELLAAGLATAAVLLAARGRPRLAGLALGCAVASKQWAVLGAVPCLAALPARRWAAVAIAALSGGLLAFGAGIADPSALAGAARTFGSTHLVNSLSAWWPVSVTSHGAAASGTASLPAGLTKTQALAGVLTLALAAQLLVWRTAHTRGRAVRPLALLALGGAIRCVGDPGPVEYYLVALIVPLAVWEVGVARRLPLLTVLASAAANFSFTTRLDSPGLNTITLLWYAALAAWVAIEGSGIAVSPPAALGRPLKPERGAPIRQACDL